MIYTARNYAAQAERFLRELAETDIDSVDRDQAIAMADAIRDSVHFVNPDGGQIMADGLRGIEGRDVRLPFPSITLEYFMEDGGVAASHGNKVAPSRKRLVHVTEEEIKGERCLVLTSVFTLFTDDGQEFWAVCPFSWVLPSRWDLYPEHLHRSTGGVGVLVQGRPTHFLPSLTERVFERLLAAGGKEDDVFMDVAGEVPAVLELLEALSCSNVTHEPVEPVDPVKNARRVRRGKLPIYETRCLIINAGRESFRTTGAGGSHASPRQHLRRGHIRRLPKGNIWVNACVVGSANDGVIEKTYQVGAA